MRSLEMFSDKNEQKNQRTVTVLGYVGVAATAAILFPGIGNADPGVSIEGTGHGQPGIGMRGENVPYPAEQVNMAPGINAGANKLVEMVDENGQPTTVDGYSQGAIVADQAIASVPGFADKVSYMTYIGYPCGPKGAGRHPIGVAVLGMACPEQTAEWHDTPKTLIESDEDPIVNFEVDNLAKVANAYTAWTENRHQYAPRPGQTVTVTQEGNITRKVIHDEHSSLYDALQSRGITLDPAQENELNKMLDRPPVDVPTPQPAPLPVTQVALELPTPEPVEYEPIYEAPVYVEPEIAPVYEVEQTIDTYVETAQTTVATAATQLQAAAPQFNAEISQVATQVNTGIQQLGQDLGNLFAPVHP